MMSLLLVQVGWTVEIADQTHFQLRNCRTYKNDDIFRLWIHMLACQHDDDDDVVIEQTIRSKKDFKHVATEPKRMQWIENEG